MFAHGRTRTLSLGVPSAFSAVGSSPMVVSVSILVLFPIGRVGLIVMGIPFVAIVVVAFMVIVFATALFWFQSIPSTCYGRIHRITSSIVVVVIVVVFSSRIVSLGILG